MPLTSRIILATAALAAAVGVACLVWSKKTIPQTASHPQSPISHPRSLPNHPVVGKILSEGPQLPYLKFNYLIKELPLHLAAHDIEALIAFISGPCPSGFQEAEWGSLVNDIEENLTVQTVPSLRVAEALIAIYRDETKIQMQRDYALQHIGGFAIYLVHTGAKGTSEPSGSSPSSIHDPQSAIFNPLLAELKSAAADTSKPWSGTALNLLDGCLRAADYRNVSVPGLNTETLVQLALPIARDPSAPLNARLPALQVAARHDSPAARDLAREILASPDPGVMLTQSAAAALARLGTQEDLALLQTASANSSRHTAPAINQAIRSIQSRLQIN
jgi:hypothetical protein